MPAADLSFLPWVRQGAAGAIATVDTLGPRQAAVADVSIALQVNTAPLPPVALRLRGPADVVGIDAHQVVRTDPRPNTTNFEPNCFPSIEFDRPDFLWLFTPARATANGQLRPWLCLVAVRKQEGVQLASTVDSPLPVLAIAAPAKPFVELPDLKDCWAWGHSQAAATGSDPTAVGNALNGPPQFNLSRLVCPRLLTPNTDYLACVVPTFELGRKAGLGLPIADTELTAVNALAPAWSLTATAPVQVQLPVFYSWEFRTGAGGDFKSLARLLRIASPQGLGQRTVVIGEPGFTLPSTVSKLTTVKVEGALMPLSGSTSPVLWSDPVAPVFEASLANIVNEPGLNQIIAPTADPLLAPPVYGRWHAGRAVVIPGAANWLDETESRSPLAYGSSARNAGGAGAPGSVDGVGVGTGGGDPAGQPADASTAVEHGRRREPARSPSHAAKRGDDAEVCLARVQPHSRGVARSGGAIANCHDDANVAPGSGDSARDAPDWPAARTADATHRRARVRPSAGEYVGGAPEFEQRASSRCSTAHQPIELPPLPTVESVVTAVWNSGFVIAAEGQPVPPLPAVDPLPPAWDYPGHFRAAAAAHLSRLRSRISVSLIPHITMGATVGVVREQMRPRVALANLARAIVAKGDNVLQPTAPGVTPLGTEAVMMAPSFPQPMYEALKEKSPGSVVAGPGES